MKKLVPVLFAGLFALTWLAPFLVFRDLLFPYITSKAFFMRVLVELMVPLYAYLLLTRPELRPDLRRNRLHQAVLAFLFFSLLATLFGVNPLKSFWGNFERMGGWYYLLHLTLLYFYAACLCAMGERFKKLAALSVLGSAALITAYGWIVWLFYATGHINFWTQVWGLLPDPTYPRVSSTLGNPIFFASFLILPIFLSLYLSIRQRGWKRYALWAFVLFQLFGVYISTTRGAMVGLAAGLFVGALAYIYLTNNQGLRRRAVAGTAAFIVLLAVGFTFKDHIPTSSPLWRLFTLRDGNTYARVIQWKTALVGYVHRPILGVGPENYYFVSNSLYDPEMYRYDPSWFDKPHNYLLEVLVTTGTFGFLAYLGILAFSVWAIYRAYRHGAVSLLEACILLAGFVTYQVQNVFVFDTIPASMAFFGTAGLLAYLWNAGREETAKPAKAWVMRADSAGLASLALLGVCCYAVYATNTLGWRVARAVNYGYAYQNISLPTSLGFFEQARTAAFDFDPTEVGGKYAEVAVAQALGAGGKPENVSTTKAMVDGAIAVNEEAIRRVGTDPTTYQRASSLYLSKAIIFHEALDPRAEAYARRAVELAPNRPEPQINLVRILLTQNKVPETVPILEHVAETIPTYPDAKMQLGFIYNANNRTSEGVKLGMEAIAAGYQVRQLRDVEWIAAYLLTQGRATEAVSYLELAYRANPKDQNAAWALMKAYGKVGNRDGAARLAEQIVQLDPTQRGKVVDYLKTLQ